MKTILQIAKEIGVSKQAIQKRISKEPLYTNIQQYIATVDGTKYIDVGGETLIKSAYIKNNQQPVADNEPTTKNNLVDSEISTLIAMLQKELDIKNEQIRDLNARLAEANAATQAAQLLHADTKKMLSSGHDDNNIGIKYSQNSPTKTKNFFSRIFNKNKKIEESEL